MSASGMYPRQFSGTDRGTTIRNPATALLCIDSEDRFADMDQSRAGGTGTDNPYDFLVTKSENILSGFFTRIGVTEVMFPWVVPNINAKTNVIQFIYKIGAGPENASFVSITAGFYKPSQIAAALQVAIRALDPALAAFDVIYGVNNQCKFTFQPNNINVTFKINPITPTNIPLLAAPARTFWNSQDLRTVHQLFDLLGLSTFPIFVGFVVGKETLCQFTRYLDIVSTQLTYNQSLKDSSTSLVTRDVLCRIYLADSGSVSNVAPSSPDFCPFGCAPFTIYRDFSSPKLINWLPNQNIAGSIRLTVYADDGSVLTVPAVGGTINQENIYWSLTLQVSEN